MADLSRDEINLISSAHYPELFKLKSHDLLTPESRVADNKATKYYSFTEAATKKNFQSFNNYKRPLNI